MKKPLFTLCCLFVVVIANAQPSDSECASHVQCNELARSAFASEDYPAALTFFMQAEKLTAPDDAETKAQLNNSIGWTYYKLADYPQARTYLLTAFEQAQTAQAPGQITKVVNNLGLLEFADGKLEEATKYFSSEWARNSETARTGLENIRIQKANNLILVGLSHQLKNNFQIAIDQYDAALLIDPDNARALGHKGAALYRQQRYDDAVETLERAYAIEPNISITVDLLKTYCASNKRDKAAALAARQDGPLAKNAEIARVDTELCQTCQGIAICTPTE